MMPGISRDVSALCNTKERTYAYMRATYGNDPEEAEQWNNAVPDDADACSCHKDKVDDISMGASHVTAVANWR